MRYFRKAKPADKEAVYSLFKLVQSALEDEGNFMWSKGYPDQSDFNGDIDNERMYLVVEDGVIVASIAYSTDPLSYFYGDSKDRKKLDSLLSRLELKSKDHILIPERLMVHPSYRGRGIATSLFRYLHEEFPTHDWLFAVFLNDANAIRLYEHLGYRNLGVHSEFEWGGQENECVLFAKNF